MTSRTARFVIAPLAPAAFMKGSAEDPQLRRALAQRLADGYLVQIALWRENGQMAWASDPTDTNLMVRLAIV